MFDCHTTSRNLIFEHYSDLSPQSEQNPQTPHNPQSLFENILATPGMSKLIHLIWDEFELWRKEKVLKMVKAITFWEIRFHFITNFLKGQPVGKTSD